MVSPRSGRRHYAAEPPPGLGEHAAEFATFSGMVDLYKEEPIERIPYSERYVWEQGIFDPLVHTLAQYYKSERSWVFVQALSGGMDGRRALAHAGWSWP